MIATTIEQSKHLLELGLSPDSADMFWMDTNSVKPCLKLMDDGIFNHRNYLVRFPNSSLPAWSLSALLDVMPKTIVIDNQNSDVEDIYVLSIEYTGDDNEAEISYMDYASTFIHSVGGEDELTAVYKMVCWLFENGYIKKGGEQ